MSNTSTIHIKTDFDCKIYDYNRELGTIDADTFFDAELRKGEHELTFVYNDYDYCYGSICISKTINYVVEDTDCDYRLVVELSDSVFNEAKELFEKKYYSAAFSLYSLLEKKGFLKAQIALGDYYKFGHGGEEERYKAVEWYRKAAERGDADAQYELGFCYRYGRGGTKLRTICKMVHESC